MGSHYLFGLRMWYDMFGSLGHYPWIINALHVKVKGQQAILWLNVINVKVVVRMHALEAKTYKM